MMNDILCVIPARSGSKGVVGKNMRMLGGKPLVVHSIDQAHAAGIPESNIVVSSDGEDILHVAKELGVVAHKRPDELCTDEASTESALLDALNTFPNHRTVLLLQPTSPIRFKGRVRECIMKYQSGDYDSLLTVTEMHNIYWSKRMDHDQVWHWCPNEYAINRPRRQELSKVDYLYFDNGNIYLTDAEVLSECNNRIGNRCCVFPISPIEGLQIDTEEEFLIMEVIFNGLCASLI
jgi:CMP-N,N'-diacetyllegionaminic acid synthase